MSASVCLSIINFAFPRVILSTWLYVLLANSVALQTTALRLTNMSAPVVIDYKEDMNLDCQFDMGSEELYAVKWYKDENEFFRYMPRQIPHVMTFPVAGVHLVNESTKCGEDRCQVRLARLDRVHSGGAYRCEVSSEAPAFRLASETHNVTVAALPKGNVSIEGLDESYYLGDILAAKCISPASDPAPNISWFINKQPAPRLYVRELRTSKPDFEGLVSSSSQLRFAIEQKHYAERTLKLSCVSSFPGSGPLTVNKTVILNNDDAEVVHNQMFYSSSVQHSSCHDRFTHYFLLMTLAALRWLI